MILAVLRSPDNSTLKSVLGSILSLNSPTFSKGLLKVISITCVVETIVCSKGSGLVATICGLSKADELVLSEVLVGLAEGLLANFTKKRPANPNIITKSPNLILRLDMVLLIDY